MRRLNGILLVLAATVLASGCLPGQSLGMGSNVGISSAAPSREPSSPPTLAPVSAPSPQATLNPPPSVPSPQATLNPPPSAAVALPVRLRIPAVNVDAEFEYVGLTPDGAMGAPANPDRVAWYKLGPRPGQPGNAAISGHVDWEGKIRAFWFLKQLGAGDEVEIVSADGKSYQFQVQWLRWFDASSGDVSEVYRSTGVRELTLITCGGTFDRQSHQYLSRLVVRAAMR